MRIINHIALKVAPVDYVTQIIIEVNELRVVTTEQLADFYGCDKMQIIQNFNNNKKHFVEGKHFFKLEGEYLRFVKDNIDDIDIVGKNARILYLWTKKGAARHCKMLGTEKAWEVFEMLEDAYFYIQELKQKEMSAGIEQKFPSTLSTSQLDRIERQIQELSDEVTNIKTYLKIVAQALS